MPQLLIHTYEEHTDDQKRALVKDLTETVCRAADVKPINVEVVFLKLNRNDRAICGKLMSDVQDLSALSDDEIPWLIVQFQLFEGRSLAQKRLLAKGVTEDIAKHFAMNAGRIQIIFSEMNRMHNAIGGLLAVDR